jgi:hypothetical protein
VLMRFWIVCSQRTEKRRRGDQERAPVRQPMKKAVIVLGSRAACSECSKFEICNIGARGLRMEMGGPWTALWWSLFMDVELRELLTDLFLEYSLKSWHQSLQDYGPWHSMQ